MSRPDDIIAIEHHAGELLGDIIADGLHEDPVCNWFLGGTSGIKPADEGSGLVDGGSLFSIELIT